jgi:hypothetical protein
LTIHIFVAIKATALRRTMKVEIVVNQASPRSLEAVQAAVTKVIENLLPGHATPPTNSFGKSLVYGVFIKLTYNSKEYLPAPWHMERLIEELQLAIAPLINRSETVGIELCVIHRRQAFHGTAARASAAMQ